LDLCFGSHGRHRRDEKVFPCQQPRDISLLGESE